MAIQSCVMLARILRMKGPRKCGEAPRGSKASPSIMKSSDSSACASKLVVDLSDELQVEKAARLEKSGIVVPKPTRDFVMHTNKNSSASGSAENVSNETAAQLRIENLKSLLL